MGRVALVTGGTRGIGAACSKALKKAGYNVAATYAGNDDAANAFKKETGIPVFKWDVGDYQACEQGVIAVENEVGPIEVLINNAGVSRDAMLQKMTDEQWSTVIRTNLDSVFNMTRQVVSGMRERGFGRVVSISSINGQQGMLGLSNYCAAKAGILGFTRSLAHELAHHHIRVNAIAPGWIHTDMTRPLELMHPLLEARTPMGKMGDPDDIAWAAVYLASTEAKFVTGQTLSPNGGWYMSQ